MKILFNVNYRTNWGESLYITGNIPMLGNGSPDGALPMNLTGVESWHAELEVDTLPEEFHYTYVVKSDSGAVRREWGGGHVLYPSPGIPVLEIFDRWQDQPWDKPYYSSAFTSCINNRSERAHCAWPINGSLNLRVSAPMVAPGEVLAISGSIEALGNWDPKKALRMSDARFPEWAANISLRDFDRTFDYKFLILNEQNGDVVAWEGRENRRMDTMPTQTDEALVVAGMRFVNPLQPWRGAGTAIPVFSLRSDEDFGVGDFYDLMKMIDWAHSTGQTFIQILPINDTTMTRTWVDSYPYNANSTFALHPMFLRLEAMGKLKDRNAMRRLERARKRLNALEEIDYEEVNRLKDEYTRQLFDQQGSETLESVDYATFYAANEHWLKGYAAFCVLRDRYQTPDWTKWDQYADYDPVRVDAFIAENRREIDYVCYIQYHLDRQMRHVCDYARSKSIAIKGDIPIGISRNSADAWLSPRLFNLNSQAGAPPDDFSVLGQNWGFPTYNWEEMNRDGFAWWKARLKKMAEYFDAYRIDHVLGFFRIWQIPMDALHGLLGVFYPALPFSPDELSRDWGFHINPELHTKPYIMDWFLGDFFGEHTEEARQRFLDPTADGSYRLKPEFDTQRKIANYFATQPKDAKNEHLCNALLGLVDNVLFIEDPEERGKYHPRISAQFTYIYRSLSDYDKWAFNRLYNDFFYRRNTSFWYGKAMWKLPPLVDATDMLACAEDLGMIPDCVHPVMNALEILSLEIQRMPKDPNAQFGNTWSYPYYSVCTTSTHDMGGIRQWWEENRESTQQYYNHVLREPGEAPFYAEPWVCRKIVDMHLKSPSMLCILPLQDWMSIDGELRREDPRKEQINVPANPRHYWRYRMHLTLEQLADAADFNRQVKDLIAASGR